MHDQTRKECPEPTLDDPHVVLLGGAGFIGSHLAEILLRRGARVTVIDDLSTGSHANIRQLLANPRFHLVIADVTAGALPITGAVDLVFHLASPASPHDYMRMPVQTLLSGSHGTLNALRLAAEHGARFVLGSTSEVYGDPAVHPQHEDYWGNVNPVGPRSQYDEAKRFAEALTVAHAGVNWAIARIFNTYGPRMRVYDGRVVPTFIRQALRDEPLTVAGDGSQTRSLCHVDDTVKGLIALAASSFRGVVNLGNPEETTVLDLATLVTELSGSTSTIKYVPLPGNDPQRRRPDISRAHKVLGWAPAIDQRAGLLSTIGWYVDRSKEGTTRAPRDERRVPAEA